MAGKRNIPRRTVVVRARVSPLEEREWKAAAAAERLTVSELLRLVMRAYVSSKTVSPSG
jgi:hypothetical protein